MILIYFAITFFLSLSFCLILITINLTVWAVLKGPFKGPWMAQQFKNAFFDLDDYPSLCICDRDQIFEGRFERMLRNYYRIKLRRTPYQSPSKNGRVERFHLSLKSEAFRNVVPINLEQAQRVCTEYKKYYNHHRPHQGIAGKIPGNSNQKQTKCTKFILHKHLGGKITSFDPNLLSAA